jgi:predicted Zn-dependent protease
VAAAIFLASDPLLALGQLAGILRGRAIGGPAGSAIVQTTQLGLGGILLKFSREFEKEADLMGAQIMARAGYDPRALAHMFETISHETATSGSGAPEWLSSHPDPGNRTQYIRKEAESLTIAKAADASEFAPIKTVFASLPEGHEHLTRSGR